VLSFPALDSRSDTARRLRQSRVLLVGVGGLGSPAALALASAGVGSLVLIDFDRVDESNLQRQLIFETADVGRLKVEAARARLVKMAPGIDVEAVNEPFSVTNAMRFVEAVDLVLDGADNFATRYLVNDACVMAGRPNVFGSVSRFDGQVAVFSAPAGPCYRCLHPSPPPDGLIQNCAEGGVLGVLPGVIGALQAVEAVKVLGGLGEPLIGRLLIYDALRMRARDIVLPRDPDCPVCGTTPTIRSLTSTPVACASGDPASEVSPEVVADWRERGVPHVLIDVREPWEQALFTIDGAVLIPSGQIGEARSGLPTDTPVILYCRSGTRSARAAALLRSSGIDARSLAGGIEAWQAPPAAGAPDTGQ
jgi:molybdopterin/thiamine biosynthesis adenylyltransferase/rhodanese-related sulfurtransferase